jgi:hypothetical protein
VIDLLPAEKRGNARKAIETKPKPRTVVMESEHPYRWVPKLASRVDWGGRACGDVRASVMGA